MPEIWTPRRANATPCRTFSYKPQMPPPPLGPAIITKTFSQDHSEPAKVQIEIEDCKLIASYNLQKEKSHSIYVPGEPQIWTPVPPHTRILPDKGKYYRDEHAVRFPDHPLDPVVQSIFQLQPRFDTQSIDVVACGTTLGNLLTHVLGVYKSFTFTVHAVGKTMFFMRRPKSPAEIIEDVYGYGHTFPAVNTSWSLKVPNSQGHYRTIQYSLGSLQVLLNFGADGYLLDQADELHEDETSDASRMRIKGPTSTRGESSLDGAAEIISKGRPIAQSAIFELKTRASHKPKEQILAEHIPRLWLRQVYNFILAYHTKGDFAEPEVLDMTEELVNWEKEHFQEIAHFVDLIKEIRRTLSDNDYSMLEIRGSEDGTMTFHRPASKQIKSICPLSTGLEKRWMHRGWSN